MAMTMPLALEVEDALLRHADINIQYRTAQNPTLSEEAQLRLATKGDFGSLGANPNITVEAQHLLVENAEASYGLEMLAENPNLALELQPVLAKSKNFVVRLELACNPSVTDEILVQLSKDRKGEVQNIARDKLRERSPEPSSVETSTSSLGFQPRSD